MCALAPLVVAAALSGPMCARLDRPQSPVMAALVGDARIEPAATDPAFEAAIRAIRSPESPKPARRRRTSR